MADDKSEFHTTQMRKAESGVFEIKSVELDGQHDAQSLAYANQKLQKIKLWLDENRFFLSICVAILVLLFYSAFLLFGNSSLQALLRLQEQRDRLKNDVDVLQKKNANIQKEIFELKGLEPK